MRVPTTPHGDYKLVLGENVILCVMYASFNREAAVEMAAEIRRMLDKSPRKASFVDNRPWGLLTPDAKPILADLNRWTIEHGVRFNAHLTSSPAAKGIIDAYLSPDTEVYQRRTFREPEEAAAWLAECGCPVLDDEIEELYRK